MADKVYIFAVMIQWQETNGKQVTLVKPVNGRSVEEAIGICVNPVMTEKEGAKITQVLCAHVDDSLIERAGWVRPSANPEVEPEIDPTPAN